MRLGKKKGTLRKKGSSPSPPSALSSATFNNGSPADTSTGGTSTIKAMFKGSGRTGTTRASSVDSSSSAGAAGGLMAEVARNVREFVKQAKISTLMTGTPIRLNGAPHYMRLGSVRVVEYCAVARLGDVPEALVAKTKIPVPSIIDVRSCYVQMAAAESTSPLKPKKTNSKIGRGPSPASLPTAAPTSTLITLVVKKQVGREEKIEQLEFDCLNERACINWTDALLVLTGKEFVAQATHDEISVFELVETELKMIGEDGAAAVPITLDAPPVPDPPEDYNFYYK